MGYVLSPERLVIAEAEPFNTVEGNTGCTAMRGGSALPGSETISRRKGPRRNLGDLIWPAVATAIPGRDRKSRRRSCRGTGEGSDGCIVPVKPRTTPGDSGGGDGGGKAAGRRDGERRRMPRTQHRNRHVTEVAIRRVGGVQNLRSRPTFGRSPVRESRTPGSVRGAVSNHRPYRARVRRRRRGRSVHSAHVGGGIEARRANGGVAA